MHTFHSYLLFNPYNIKNKQNNPYQVFTSFYQNGLNHPVTLPAPYIEKIKGIELRIDSLTVHDLHLLPKIQWDKKFHSY